jgi:hypothetical protein
MRHEHARPELNLPNLRGRVSVSAGEPAEHGKPFVIGLAESGRARRAHDGIDILTDLTSG